MTSSDPITRPSVFTIGAVAVAAVALVLAGFAMSQRNVAQTAERQSRATLALSDFATANTEPASRALARLARAIRTDPDKSAIGRRALYLMAEHPYLLPLPPGAAEVNEGWQRSIVHDMQEAAPAPDQSVTIKSPNPEDPWTLTTGAVGTPCETRMCVQTAQPPQDPMPVQMEMLSKPRVTFPADGRFAVMVHGICIEFGGHSELVAVENDGRTGFRLVLDNEMVHALALSPDGRLLFVEMNNCGETLEGFDERRRVQVFRVMAPSKPPILLHTIVSELGELQARQSLAQIRVGQQRFLTARVMREEFTTPDLLDNDNPKSSDFAPGEEEPQVREVRSHNGKLVARTDSEGHAMTVKVVDAQTGAKVLPDIVVVGETLAMFFPPDDSWFGAVGVLHGERTGLLTLMDVPSGLEFRPRKGHVAPYRVRKDGRRILAGGWSSGAGIHFAQPVFFDIIGEPTPTPAWVADLAEGIGGWRLDARAVFERLTDEQRLERLERVRNAVIDKPTGDNRWLEFAQWYLGDSADGRVSPYAAAGGTAKAVSP